MVAAASPGNGGWNASAGRAARSVVWYGRASIVSGPVPARCDSASASAGSL